MELNYSLSTWSFEGYAMPLTLEEAVAEVVRSGYGVEIWPRWRDESDLFSESHRARTVKLLKDVPSSLHGGRISTLGEHKIQIEAARDTGSTVIVVHSDTLGLQGRSSDHGLARDVVAYASENRVTIALENGDSIGSMDRLTGALDAVPDLRACLDIGHVYAAHDYPLREYLERLGSRIVHLHLQDVYMVPGTRRAREDSHRPPGQCDIPVSDWRLLFSTLEKIGFTGQAVIEFRPFDPTEIAAQVTRFFESIC